MLVLILVCMERGDRGYTMVPIRRIWGIQFSSSQGVVTIPRVTEKGLGRQELNLQAVCMRTSAILSRCRDIGSPP